MRSDDEQVNEIEELREQLAAASALLERCKEQDLPWGLLEDIRAHLAAQPATAPARGDVLSDGTWIRTPEEERAATAPARTEAEPNTHRRGCVCVRCEAEQAVLAAVAKAFIYQDTRGAAVFAIPSEEGDICRAELARRGLAKK